MESEGGAGVGATVGAPVRRRGRVLRWIAPVLLVLVLALTWGYSFAGGMGGVAAWFLLMSAVPVIGGLFLLVSAVRAIWTRTLGWSRGVTMLLSLVALYPAAWMLGVGMIAYPASLGSTQPAVTVRLPSNHALRVGWGGDRLASNYHAFYPDQRWAYDLLVDPYLVQSAELTDYGCYGTEVIAPANGVVRAAHGTDPDLPPGEPLSPSNPFGNHVALELPTGTFLVLAHLQKESIRVQVGQPVHEGEVLGLCGNSGNTSEPHIHIHHQRQNPAEQPPGFAEGLPLFFRDHDGPAMPAGGIEVKDGKPQSIGAIVRHLGATAR